MNANTGIWVGLGVLGVLIIASLDSGASTKTPPKEEDKPNVEPKKVQL
ncbi:hypothetical protein [Flavobacterium sp.]